MKTAEMPVPTESTEQRNLFTWAKYQYGVWPELRLMYHTPNEGLRNSTTGARMRLEGLKRGVPDICLPVARGKYHGLYIEMKRTKGGVVSEDQRGWLEALNAQGYKAVVCKGCEAAIATIIGYLEGKA